jgi:hypothetical protein
MTGHGHCPQCDRHDPLCWCLTPAEVSEARKTGMQFCECPDMAGHLLIL